MLLVCTPSYAQHPYVPAASKHTPVALVPLLQVLKELNRTRGVYFLYTARSVGETLVNDTYNVNAELEDILTQILKGTHLHYRKVNALTFVILEGDAATNPGPTGNLLQEAGMSIVGNTQLTGLVSSTEAGPLAGVTVRVKGDGPKGPWAITDETGAFSIQAPPGSALVFSSVGYEDRVMEAGTGPLQVILKPAKRELNEVVLTALGIKKPNKSVGYATTTIPGYDLTQSRETNLGNAFTGKVAGVSVAGDATGPSGSSRVIIRGNASVMGNNQPLYLVDGIPYDNTNWGGFASQYGGKDYGDGLSNINPDDIESIQVLKGVAASALYGYRGGNGAILVTTKSGADARGIRVEVNNNVTVNRVIDERDFQYVYGQGTMGTKDTTQIANMSYPYYSWGGKMDGSRAVNFLGNSYAYLPQRRNFEHFYKTGVTNQTSLAVSGGNSKGHFRLGVSDLYLDAVIPNSDMKDQGINFNSTLNITSHLQLTTTCDYVFEQVKNRASFSDAPGNLIATTLYLANSFDIRWLEPQVNASGSELLPGTGATYFSNPYFVAYRFENNTDRNRLTGAITLRYNFLHGFFAQGQVTRDGYVFDVTDVVPTGTGYATGGEFTQYELNFRELNENFMMGWNRQFGRDLKMTIDGGGNSQDNLTQDYGVGMVPTLVQGVAEQPAASPFNIPYVYTAANILQKPYTRGYAHYRVNSFYGILDVGYKNYLYLTATARNDWYSTLSIASDRYLYPSLSGSFVFSEVWHLPKWISLGKWRASYAQASNGTSPYQNVLNYGIQNYVISGQSLGYVAQSYIPNAHLKPVSIREWETGLNLGLLGGRLGLDVAYYNKKTADDILPVSISATSGYTGDYLNTGSVRNEGVELLVTATPVKAGHFQWDLSWNYANNASKVLNLGPGTPSYVISGAQARWGGEVSVSNVVGLPYGQIVGYAYKRDAHGNILYNSGGEPDQTGVVPLGSGVYKVTGGVSNQLHYRNWTLSWLIDYKFGARIYSQTNLLLYFYGLQKTTLQGREGGYVGKGVNDITGKPNSVSVPAEQYFQDISAGGSDHIAEEFIYDASFIKLRSFSLSYSIPPSHLQGSRIRGVCISLVGRNVLTLLKHTPNIDPESNLNATNGQGLELSGYPTIRSLGFNVNLKF
ncbi:SusC/RagA family TonB-linked outer membrane protein [Dinghuibacter silviterrae]|uniref:TonB-linked SusC/RagA family outer membrane protein n=1 Tax=Dinghuibacter silviterrae TaxID=1539049 RepID=A0A4R8DHI5_9BACT|nr:SusC/RagA family TonB-linked outer membrane protein [Dinghuibacter silviterrae]TDW96995.1 TonB-linked SusC/RagA family outer membrane protein [Dinghuibacter silviterrae]